MLSALSHVKEDYLTYADNNDNINDNKNKTIEERDDIQQLERVFAYEFYHQWSIRKSPCLVLNAEMGKIINRSYHYPDMALHGGQGDHANNKIILEIKRVCSIGKKGKNIVRDLLKLSVFLNYKKEKDFFANYENAVFILLKGSLEQVYDAVKHKRNIRDEIICITYDGKTIEIETVGDLKNNKKYKTF